MKDLTKEQMQNSGYPEEHHDPLDLVEFCLEALAKDTEHSVFEEFVYGLTFEELIGALKVAARELTVYGECEWK